MYDLLSNLINAFVSGLSNFRAEFCDYFAISVPMKY